MMGLAHSSDPRCSDREFGYAIGNCCGCHRFPVVLYKIPNLNRWRCMKCYKDEARSAPPNPVSL